MDGRPLLCKTGEGEIQYRDQIFGMRDRLDSRYEMIRTVRDKRFRYQRNYYPHLPFNPHEDFAFGAAVVQKWVELARQGKLTGPQEMLAMRFKPVEELYDSESDPYLINNVIDDRKYAEVVKRMRGQLREWMLETHDLGLLDEAETLLRAESYDSHWELGQSLDNCERMLDTADLQIQGKAATSELLARVNDPDSAVRFWAVLGLVALQSDDAKVVSALQAATKDASVSVRITAADGLFNLRRYEDGLPAIIDALGHPVPAARIRASCILDTQPPEANAKLETAIEPLRTAASELNVIKMPGIPFGLNTPFERAVKAITGEENYYRWSPGASGSPKNK